MNRHEATTMLKQLPGLLIFIAMLASAPAIADSNPTDDVRTSVEAVIALLKDDQLDRDTRRDRMREVIDKRFDFRAMSQRTLATNWKKATDAEKQRFTELFSELIQNSYVSKIESYTNETVEYPGEKQKGRKAVVDTLIITSKTVHGWCTMSSSRASASSATTAVPTRKSSSETASMACWHRWKKRSGS
jgi:phospholipid transport system substrate-binding protein